MMTSGMLRASHLVEITNGPSLKVSARSAACTLPAATSLHAAWSASLLICCMRSSTSLLLMFPGVHAADCHRGAAQAHVLGVVTQVGHTLQAAPQPQGHHYLGSSRGQADNAA